MRQSETIFRQQLRTNKVKNERRRRVPIRELRFKALRQRPEPISEAALVQRVRQELLNRLQATAESLQTISSHDLAALLSALALAEIALPDRSVSGNDLPEPEGLAYEGIPAESVVDYSDVDVQASVQASDDFLWRRQLEQLWRTHLTKDEFHRPVVRSLGVPVMCIVSHVRKGLSWDSICKLYPGLIHEEIQASVSMATECGWVSAEDD